jgi:hypothetical protein
MLHDQADEVVYPVVQDLSRLGQLHGKPLVPEFLLVRGRGKLDAGFGERGNWRLGGLELVVENLEYFAGVRSVGEG